MFGPDLKVPLKPKSSPLTDLVSLHSHVSSRFTSTGTGNDSYLTTRFTAGHVTLRKMEPTRMYSLQLSSSLLVRRTLNHVHEQQIFYNTLH